MLDVTNCENHQPKVLIYQAPNIVLYLEAHPDAKEAYTNEIIQPMERGEFPGKLTDELPGNVQAHYIFLSTGELVCYQVTSQHELQQIKYFVHHLVPSQVIEDKSKKSLLTKGLSNVNKLVTSLNQVVTTHKTTFLVAGAITAIIRFFTF